MSSPLKVYIAGIGLSPLPSQDTSEKAIIASLVSAATKALLDAGVTIEDITNGVIAKSSKYGSKALEVFEQGGITVDKVDRGTEFESAFKSIQDQGVQNILVIAEEKSSVFALVLASENFLWSRSYLKDSSALIRESSSSTRRSSMSLSDVCEIVWALRGWSRQREGDLIYQASSKQSFELSRADGQKTPIWAVVEHKQDGRHRLGYNPAMQTKEICSEDLEAVIATGANSGRPQYRRRGADRAALARL